MISVEEVTGLEYTEDEKDVYNNVFKTQYARTFSDWSEPGIVPPVELHQMLDNSVDSSFAKEDFRLAWYSVFECLVSKKTKQNYKLFEAKIGDTKVGAYVLQTKKKKRPIKYKVHFLAVNDKLTEKKRSSVFEALLAHMKQRVAGKGELKLLASFPKSSDYLRALDEDKEFEKKSKPLFRKGGWMQCYRFSFRKENSGKAPMQPCLPPPASP